MIFFMITNCPKMARFAINSGVDRIFVDTEILGKELRQGHLDTLISRHTLDDVRCIRPSVPKGRLLVRINPIHQESQAEIDCAIEAGADILMLPMFRSVAEVQTFIAAVNGRALCNILVETVAAATSLKECVQVPGVDEVHIGLNDLHLELGLDFMFEPLASGLIDKMAVVLRDNGIPFGIGGIARVGEGLLPAELLLAEHARLGSTAAILSRTFHRQASSVNEIRKQMDFPAEILKLRDAFQRSVRCDSEELQASHRALQKHVQSIAVSRKARKAKLTTQAPRSLLGAGLLLSLAMMAGRFAGFGREVLLASALGLSAQADMAIVLLTVPDLLVNLLLSGGIGVALVPALRSTNTRQAAALFIQVSIVVGGGFAALAVLCMLVPTVWLGLLAPGIPNPLHWLKSWMVYTVAAAIPLTALSGVSSAALNAKDRFFVVGCGTLLFNLCIISGLFLAMIREEQYLMWLCVSILFGALLRWISQCLALKVRRCAFQQRWLLDRHLFRGFLAGLASSSLLVLVPVILRAGASWLKEGELAAFNYAIKLVELPLGIVITTLATVVFPRLSEAHDRQDENTFKALLNVSLQRSLGLSLAVVLCGLPFAGAVISILFGAGRLDAAGLQKVTALTQIALLCVPGIGVSSLATAALNARKRPGLVLRRTFIIMLFLPVFCLPGLWLRAPLILMWALPIFHMMLAVTLLQAVGWQTLIPGNRWYMKRLFDLFCSLIAIVFFFPVLIVVAIAIYLSDFGPVIFKQQRVGLGGRDFFIYKFRSMVINAEKLGGYSTTDADPRITKVGRFIRRTSLDELPQLFNVLFGTMSMVGPRPDVPMQRALYTEAEWQLRNSVRPGITGLAQSKLRSAATEAQRKSLDLQYIQQVSLLKDIQLILLTFRQIFGKGGN